MTLKNNYLLLVLLTSLFLIASCEDEQPTFVEYDNYKWTKLDADGGDWKPIVMTSNESVALDAPDQSVVASELEAVKKSLLSISQEQKDIANYWTNNPVIRWNEIARDLAAKYNLAPAPNADGTYPVPDAANPSTYPLFPFAHPPYSSRAFAYLSVATLDGLISAWHYKYKFNRPSIKSLDSSIEPFYGDNGLPTYPSDGAVVTATAQTILSAMFPLEKEFIAQKAAEHLASLTYTASALKSDIDAGTKLGTDVAKLALARASSDGMKKAQTSKAVADSIKNAAISKFGWSYQSLEIPERKVGITAMFGQVKTWAVKDLVAIRPPVPPALNSAEFKKDVDELLSIAKNRSGEQRRIANFWADGTSTYTPPGHWNRIACNSIVGEKYNPLRTARTLAYMNMAIMDAGIACWDAKYYYHYPRPVQTISGFKAILGTPNFPSYVSGHSTFSSAGASVLSYIFPQAAATFDGFAKDASDSRIYGGIHYRFDCEEGLKLGQRVAKETIELAVKDGAK